MQLATLTSTELKSIEFESSDSVLHSFEFCLKEDKYINSCQMGTSMSDPIIAERNRLNQKVRILTSYSKPHASF
jgi:hypothetical protein